MPIAKKKRAGVNDILRTILLIPILPIFLVFSLFTFIADKFSSVRIKKFWKDNQDKIYFFYSNKHGWHDFVVNNIIPALPNNCIIINIYKNIPNCYFKILRLIELSRQKGDRIRLPFIIKLSLPDVNIYSFYEDFNEISKHPKRNPEIQNKLTLTIEKVLNE